MKINTILLIALSILSFGENLKANTKRNPTFGNFFKVCPVNPPQKIPGTRITVTEAACDNQPQFRVEYDRGAIVRYSSTDAETKNFKNFVSDTSSKYRFVSDHKNPRDKIIITFVKGVESCGYNFDEQGMYAGGIRCDLPTN